MICLLTRLKYTPRLYDNSIDFRCPAIISNVRACCQEHQVVFGRLSCGFGMSPVYLIRFFLGAYIFAMSVRLCVCIILLTYVV
jgi:hypothetical protein